MNSFYPPIPTTLQGDAALPAYAHEGDAGVDLCSTEDVTLRPGEWQMVGSKLSMAIPAGFAGLVVPRSGLGCKGLVLKNTIGVIDSGYRGEIGLTLYNNNPQFVWKLECPKAKKRFPRLYKWLAERYGEEPMVLEPNIRDVIHVRKGDRVAQMLIVPVALATFLQVKSLDDTERGTDGFGSSGYGRL